MRQCIFPACKSRPDDRVGNVALVHRFPREEHVRKLWIQWIKEKCGLPDFVFNIKAGLCYRHFERQCYHRSNGLLKPFSYPTFTPQDLDNNSFNGSSVIGIRSNGVPKTNLIIKLDPTLLKKSTSEKSDPEKKFVLLVTDKGMQTSEASKSNLSFVTQKQPAMGMMRPRDVPPLRFIGRSNSTPVAGKTLFKAGQSSPTKLNTVSLLKSQYSGGATAVPPSVKFVPVQKYVKVAQSTPPNYCLEEQLSSVDCLPERKSFSDVSNARSSSTLNILQTVLDSSRKRLRGYRRRLQLEKKRMNRLEKLLEEMKEKKLISGFAAEKIESILNDE